MFAKQFSLLVLSSVLLGAATSAFTPYHARPPSRPSKEGHAAAVRAAPSTISARSDDMTTPSHEADFVALGLGGTGMMAMLWSLAMGKSCIGVEMRGDPFLRIHWNIREDFYHQLGLIDELMLKRYGRNGVPRRANGKLFKLAECFYSPKTTSGFIVADEIINGYDKIHHICGTIEHIEFIDDRHRNGEPSRSVTVLPPPRIPKRPNPKAIRSSVREVLDGPSTFQSEANNVLILLRRYLEAVQAMDEQNGVEPRVRLFTHHVVKENGGFVEQDNGRVCVNIQQVQELDYKGKLIRTPIPGTDICIQPPELCVIAQGSNSVDARRLGFESKDVVVDHMDGHGPTVAQADYLAGFIDVLVDGRLRRRIASAVDDKTGREYWVRQIAVGHENDPQVGWVLVQIPDYMTFDPIEAGLVEANAEMESPEYFAAYQNMLYDFYIQECSKLLEMPEEVLREVRMAYGPKMFSLVENMGEDPRIAPNVVVAGDSFGNGHFLTSGGAMTGMVGHSMAVLNYWKNREGTCNDMDMDDAYKVLAQDIKAGTQDWLDASAQEFSSFSPINFGADRIEQIAKEQHIDSAARAESIDASRRTRHELKVQDPSDWRRPILRNGRVLTESLEPPKLQNSLQLQAEMDKTEPTVPRKTILSYAGEVLASNSAKIAGQGRWVKHKLGKLFGGILAGKSLGLPDGPSLSNSTAI